MDDFSKNYMLKTLSLKKYVLLFICNYKQINFFPDFPDKKFTLPTDFDSV